MIVTMITSDRNRLQRPGLGDVVLTDWQRAGLLAPSVARTGRLQVIEQRLLSAAIGHLDDHTMTQIDAGLRDVLGIRTPPGPDRACDLRVGSEVVDAGPMAHIVQRNTRFYVVAYDGLDPITGRERRRWHPAGHDRTDAEALAQRLDAEAVPGPPRSVGSIMLGSLLRETWLPQKLRLAIAA